MTMVEKTTLTASDRAKVDEIASSVGVKVLDYAAARRHFRMYDSAIGLAFVYGVIIIIIAAYAISG